MALRVGYFCEAFGTAPGNSANSLGNTVACERSNMYMGKILKNNNRNTDTRRVTGKVY